MQQRVSRKLTTQNVLKKYPKRYIVEYGLILIIALIAICRSEYNDQGHSPRKYSYLEGKTTDVLNDKSKTSRSMHRKLKRTIRGHNSQTKIWQHQCDRKPSGARPTQLPVVFYCIPMYFLNDSSESKSNRNKTISSKKKSIPSPGPTEDLTTLRTQRNLDRVLMNASLQFDVPADVTDLRLWFQGIVSAEDNAFMGLNRLKLLGLQNNEISYLSQDAFAGLNILEQLDLSNNRLGSIRNTVFRHLRNLTTLNLRFNEIVFIQNSLFCGLDHISILDLSYNLIEDIDKYALQHFRSSYALTIDVSHNKLKTPRAEWLMLSQDENTNTNCRVESPTKDFRIVNVTRITGISQFDKSISGMEIVIKRTETDVGGKDADRKYSMPPVRLLRATNNPWSCECDGKMRLIDFIRQYQSFFSAQLNGAATVEDVGTPETESNVDTVDKITDSKTYASWYFSMPCSEKEYQGIDLGRLTTSHRAIIEKSCCQKLYESSSGNDVIAKDKEFRKSCKKGNGTTSDTLTDNHVTIIGIVIVFSTPILLTLCPDCNRTVAPSSRNDVQVTSSGKFGAVSLNANNNTGQWIDRKSKRKPFENERFCLVVQEHGKNQKVSKPETVF